MINSLTYSMTNYHVILEVQLVPQEGCECFQNSEIWVCLEKLT